MGLHNRLHLNLQCPRCGQRSDFEIETKVGYLNQFDYKLGDRVDWWLGQPVASGGRPPRGDLDVEGYAECSICHRDFYTTVKVRGDHFRSVEHDASRPPLIPDP
jgi:hypothetical protein